MHLAIDLGVGRCIYWGLKDAEYKDIVVPTLSEVVRVGYAKIEVDHPFARLFAKFNVGGMVPGNAAFADGFLPETPGYKIVVTSHKMRVVIANELQYLDLV